MSSQSVAWDRQSPPISQQLIQKQVIWLFGRCLASLLVTVYLFVFIFIVLMLLIVGLHPGLPAVVHRPKAIDVFVL